MDISRYSEKTRRLIAEIEHEPDPTGRRFARLLAALKKCAQMENDNSLWGFWYFNRAGAAHEQGKHAEVYTNCQKALTVLLRSTDRALTALTYDLFGVEAYRLGCLDVAQHYFQVTQTFIEGDDMLLTRGILETNISDLLMDMGDLPRACRHKKTSIEIFRRCPYDGTIPARIALVTANCAMLQLYSGKPAEAKKLHKQAERLLQQHALEEDETLARWLLLLRAHIAFINHDEKQTDQTLRDVIREIVSGPSFGMYRKYLYQYCRLLIEAKEWKKGDLLLEAMVKNTLEDTPAYESFRLAQLFLDHSRAIGSKAKMLDGYERRNRFYGLYQKDRNRIYHESIALMRVTDDLHREQYRTQQENARLLRIAETDALTGIPNRYALNRVLEEVFERSLETRTRFGIGMIDIDDFKQYNDTFGHQAGDDCLRSTARALQSIAKEHGTFLARYGGDEYVLIYEDMRDREIREMEKRMHEALPVSVSHGFYNAVPGPDSRPWDFFSKADQKLYSVKRKR